MWGAGILVVGVIVVGLAKILGPAFTQTELPADFSVGKVTAADHVKGDVNSKVTLIEYGDFQCSACGAYYPLVKRLEADLGDKIALVYRHFPLRSAHPHAETMARASEAAGKQGKFFEMHDMIFENQDKWSSESRVTKVVLDYATQLGLDITKFEKDMDSFEVKDKIQLDLQGGREADISGTPSFFLNGQPIRFPSGYDDLKATVEAALAIAK